MLVLISLLGLTWYAWRTLRTPNPIAKFILGFVACWVSIQAMAYFSAHPGPYPPGYVDVVTDAMILPLTIGLVAFILGAAFMVLAMIVPPAPPRRRRR